MNRRSVSTSTPSHPVTFVLSDDEEKRSATMITDVEKQLLHHRSSSKKRRNNNAIKYLSIGMGILLVLIIAGSAFSFNRRNSSRQSEVDRFQQDTLELLSSVLGGTVEQPDDSESASKSLKWNTAISESSGDVKIPGRTHWSGTVKGKPRALAKAVVTVLPEVQNHEGKQGKNEGEEEEDELHNLKDLKEMLSVSPMTIFVYLGTPVETRFVQIMQNLVIVPPPAIVDLKKHPHFHQIVEYLKTYQAKESQTENDDFARIFLHGLPVATMEEAILLYEERLLLQFLRLKGKGMITVD